MKILKCITIFTYLFILNSCQNETINTDEQTIDTPGIELIDESYAEDLKTYEETPIVFDNSEHSIAEVLTDPVLFNLYKNAHTHYLTNRLGTDERVLYITSETEEEAEKMVTKIKASTTRMNANLGRVTIEIVLFKNTRKKGKTFRESISLGNGIAISNRTNVSSNMLKQASSMKVTIDNPKGLEIISFRAEVYTKLSQNGKKLTFSDNTKEEDLTVPYLVDTLVGDNSIQSIYMYINVAQ